MVIRHQTPARRPLSLRISDCAIPPSHHHVANPVKVRKRLLSCRSPRARSRRASAAILRKAKLETGCRYRPRKSHFAPLRILWPRFTYPATCPVRSDRNYTLICPLVPSNNARRKPPAGRACCSRNRVCPHVQRARRVGLHQQVL